VHVNGRPPAPNAAERFTARAVDYARYRPRYPRSLVTLLEAELGLRPEWRIADLGSGTGLSSEPFLAHGNPVWAVEPNDEMRRAAEELLGASPLFHSVAGHAERTGLPDADFDLILAAQAFHWFDVDAARAETLRILRPGGWAVLVWNTRRSDDSAFLRAYEELLQRHGTDYGTVRHDRLARAALERFFGGPFTARVLENEQRMDRDALRGRLASTSYVPAHGQPGHAAMMRDLDTLFDVHQERGQVRFPYDLEVYWARPDRG
jgi:SAM-dependent methyltransferase